MARTKKARTTTKSLLARREGPNGPELIARVDKPKTDEAGDAPQQAEIIEGPNGPEKGRR